LEDHNKVIKIQNKEIENLKLQSNNANQENKEITYLKKQVENINKELILRLTIKAMLNQRKHTLVHRFIT